MGLTSFTKLDYLHETWNYRFWKNVSKSTLHYMQSLNLKVNEFNGLV